MIEKTDDLGVTTLVEDKKPKATRKRKIMTPKHTGKVTKAKAKKAVKAVFDKKKALDIPKFLNRNVGDENIVGYIEHKRKLIKVGANGNFYNADTDKKVVIPKEKG